MVCYRIINEPFFLPKYTYLQMKQIKFLLIVFISSIVVSCGGGGVIDTQGQLLELLNSGSTTPTAYMGMMVPGGNFLLYNSDFYTCGAAWIRIDESKEGFNNAHKIEITTPDKFEHNIMLLDADSSYVHMVNSRGGKIYNCRGCNYCYQKYHEMGLIDYEILEGEVGAGGNLKVSTKLTAKGAKYEITPLHDWMMEKSDIEYMFMVAKHKFTKILSCTETVNSAIAEVEYYTEYSPFAEALGHKTDKRDTQVVELEFEKSKDGVWRRKSLGDKE